MKRKLALVIGVIVVFTIAGIMIFSAYRSSESYRKKKAAETYKMTGTVLEITNGTMIVEPLEGEDELSSSDKFVISVIIAALVAGVPIPCESARDFRRVSSLI